METISFNGAMDVAVSGIDAYKRLVIATNLIPLGMMADMMDSFAGACKVDERYYVKYDPLGLNSFNQDRERHPLSEEGFYAIGKTIQHEDLFLKDGRMFIVKDESKVINPVGYNVATMTSATLRMMMQGITCGIDMLDQTTRNMNYFLEMAKLYRR